jgi:hypothetical protein
MHRLSNERFIKDKSDQTHAPSMERDPGSTTDASRPDERTRFDNVNMVLYHDSDQTAFCYRSASRYPTAPQPRRESCSTRP